jgi:hypothetical protein
MADDFQPIDEWMADRQPRNPSDPFGRVGARSAWLISTAFGPRNHDRERMALAQETVWNWNQRSRFSRSPVTQ